ncbi:MAG: TonB family protein [Gammaproteobacteria bacterium]|nr:TonB family protein [Gammaproteobacteria bacterium]MDH3374344.1 TonB family protein [Gammaproteobacteria bacterium]MDH3409880.1 TonB family protein [Gammaproteobacteria bacterium]MDH3551277.1 TonB family protein [Gammaproteobacteria bacterium]
MDLPFYREYELPWSAAAGQERKFQRLLGIVFLVTLALSLVWPFIPTPERDPNEVEEIPPRIAKLLLEQKPPPPPPKPKEPEPEPEPEPEAEPEKVVENEPEPEPEPIPEPEPVPDQAEIAREQAQAAFMPFAEDLADLVDQDLLDKVADDRPLSASVGQAARNERSMITSKVGAASGGINTSTMSRNTGGTGIAGRSTTKVASPVAAVAPAGGARRTGTSGKASRSREEIELVFDKNKGAIFSLYNRALRNDPSLEGKLVLRLTIAPNGAVTFCEVVSSELGDPDLERKLVQRIKLFRFEAKDVEPITTTKPIDFFPA